MKKIETQLKQLQSAHTMSMSEKAEMRDALSEYQALKPVRTTHRHSLLTTPLTLTLFAQHKLLSAALILVLFLSSGAGAAYASTDALPGERLYSVKELVEEVHERILVSDEAKAELAERLTQKREEEAQRLEELGKLDEVRQAILDRRITRHKARAERVLTRLEKRAPQKAAVIRDKINNKITRIQNIKHAASNKRFLHLMDEIEREYAESEQLATALEQELQTLSELIPN